MSIQCYNGRVTSASTQPVPRKKPSGVNGRMTEQQFVDWCDERTWAEWVDGEVVLMSPINFQHADLLAFLTSLFRAIASDSNLGPVVNEPMQVRFARQHRRRSPDLMFISNDRRQIIKPAHVEGAPDLILEIISADSQSRDRREKFLEYQSAGVREYWIIDPFCKTVEVYTLGENQKYRSIASKAPIKSLVLPGLAIKPAWLWRENLPSTLACLREMKSRK